MKRSIITLPVMASLLLSAQPSRSQDMPPALVVTQPVQKIDFHQQLTLVGRTYARAESRIVSEVSGRVMEINAKEGRWVARGAPLVTIDPAKIKLYLEAKRAETAQAQINADLAQKELARAEDLHRQEILPDRTFDQATADASRTIERLNQLKAELQQLELDFDNTTIRAPYAGFTVRYLVQVGEWVIPGTPVYEMVDLGIVKVVVDLPERNFGQVEIGSAVAIVVSGDTKAELTGKVSGIAPQASEATHTFPVIVAVNNKDGQLGSGMLVRTTVSLKGTFSSLAVSKDAIIRQGDRTMVYTVVEGKASPINVTMSSSEGTMVAVKGDGLQEGMPVVIRGNERIFPGSPVRMPEQKEQEGGAASQGKPDADAGNGEAASGSR